MSDLLKNLRISLVFMALINTTNLKNDNFRWIINLNVKPRIKSLLEKKKRRLSSQPWSKQRLFRQDTKSTYHTGKK